MNIFILVIIFIAASVIGYKLISNVPAMLHTPLMSGMNALSGVTIAGALVATTLAVSLHSRILGVLSIILAMINVSGGFLVTHRMLKMFKNKQGS
jgi:NAD(P) transhydrogenase subunit alpha